MQFKIAKVLEAYKVGIYKQLYRSHIIHIYYADSVLRIPTCSI